MEPISAISIASSVLVSVDVLTRLIKSLGAWQPTVEELGNYGTSRIFEAAEWASRLQSLASDQQSVDPSLKADLDTLFAEVKRLERFEKSGIQSEKSTKSKSPKLSWNFLSAPSLGSSKVSVSRRKRTKSSKISKEAREAQSLIVRSSLDILVPYIRTLVELYDLRLQRDKENLVFVNRSSRYNSPFSRTDLPGVEDQTQSESSSDSSPTKDSSLDRLQTPDYKCRHKRYHDSRVSRTPDSCTWLFDTPEYQKWAKEIDNTIFWCRGDPGIGKSILTSRLVDHYQEPRISHAYFYMGYGKVQTAADVVASLLKQLCEYTKSIPSNLERALVSNETREKVRPPFVLLLDSLESMPKLGTDPNTIILLDSWDIDNMDHVSDFMEIIRIIQHLKWKLFITSRTSDPRVIPPLPNVHFELAAHHRRQDIETFVRSVVASNLSASKLLSTSPKLEDEIVRIIGKRSKGFFFWAEVQIDLVLEQATVSGVRQAIKDMPTEPGDLVGKALQLIELQPERSLTLARTTLIWLALLNRPIYISGLCEALAIDPEKRSLDPEMIPSVESLTKCCMSLITVDLGTSTVVLAHHEVACYMERHWKSHFAVKTKQVAAACLGYLLLDDFASGPCLDAYELRLRLKNRPFLEYAAHSWFHHVQQSESSDLDRLNSQLFHHSGKLASAIEVLECSDQLHSLTPAKWAHEAGIISCMSRLQIAARLGMPSVVKDLLEDGDDPLFNKHEFGTTPLQEAYSNKHPQVVKLLLDAVLLKSFKRNLKNPCDLIPDFGDRKEIFEYYRTEILESESIIAALKAHDLAGLLFLLCGNGDPNCEDEDGSPAIHVAVQCEFQDAVSALLLAGAEVNKCDSNAETALRKALVIPNKEIRQMMIDFLLDQGAYIDGVEVSLTRSLSMRSRMSKIVVDNNSIVESAIALESPVVQGAHVMTDQKITSRATILFEAVKANDKTFVEYLLSRGANPDIGPKDQKPLFEAVRNYNLGITKVLLEQGADPDIPCSDGQSVLHLASSLAQRNIVEILLRYGADINYRDARGQTPLFLAIASRDIATVRCLVQCGVDVEAAQHPEAGGQRALHVAATLGDQGIFALILNSCSDSSPKDESDKIPLDYAKEHGFDGIVRLLKATSNG